MICANTFFTKPNEKLITYREKAADVENEDWENRYAFAQIDFLWIMERRRNAIKNEETDTHTKFPSDHYPLIATLKIRLEKR